MKKTLLQQFNEIRSSKVAKEDKPAFKNILILLPLFLVFFPLGLWLGLYSLKYFISWINTFVLFIIPIVASLLFGHMEAIILWQKKKNI